MIVEVRDDTLVLSGNLLCNAWRTLEAPVRLLLQRHPEGLILDCSELAQLTVPGAETLRDAEAKLAQHSARLVVAGLRPELGRTLRSIPNLASRLAQAENVAAARTSLGLVPRQTSDAGTIAAVVLLGSPGDAYAVRTALQITSDETALLLLYPLAVPRDRSLLSSLGPDEEQARAEVERFETAVRAVGRRVLTRVERTRNRAQRVLAVLEELQVSRLIVGIGGSEEELREEAQRLVEKARCPVLCVRVPGESRG